MKNQLLFTPGPVPLTDEIAAAGAHVELYHQSDAYTSVVHDLSHRLQEVFLSDGPVLMLSGSGMTGIDASAASLQHASDHVLVLHHGRFGERLLDIARIYSATVESISAPWGDAIDIGAVERYCSSVAKLDVVWCVHSETSTGVSIDVQSIASIVRRYYPEALVCVDAVTSVAIQELRSSAWGLDAVVTGIQKGLCCSPGLALVALSDRARERTAKSRPLFTLDLHRVVENLRNDRMTWTPPTSLVAQLSVAVDSILSKGLPSVWSHHNALYDDVRARAESRGFSVWGQSTSRGVLVMTHPDGDGIRRELEHTHNMIIANGQDAMAGEVVRFGLCGSYTSERYSILFDAIDSIISR